MLHAGSLGGQVREVVGVGRDDQWCTVGDAHAVACETSVFGRVVGHQSDFADPEVVEDLRARPIFT